MDTINYMVQSMLPIAIALMVVAIGGMFTERSGVINIALEGTMLFGAFFGAFITLFLQDTGLNPQLVLIISMLIAGVAGMIFSLLLAVAAIHLKADQTIIGTALNMLVPAIIILYARMMFTSNGITTNIDLYVREVPFLSQIPIIGDLFFKRTYITVYLGIGILIASSFFLFKTKTGLEIRACGEHPQAADSVGINVYKMRYLAVMLSGLLGGIGGYFYSVGVMSGNVNGDTGVAGYGFLALAVMIFGQWKPLRIFLGSLLFAFLQALDYSIPLIPFLRDLGIDSTVYKMLPYIVTLVVLVFTSKRSMAPKAEGIPYDKGQR